MKSLSQVSGLLDQYFHYFAALSVQPPKLKALVVRRSDVEKEPLQSEQRNKSPRNSEEGWSRRMKSCYSGPQSPAPSAGHWRNSLEKSDFRRRGT